MNDEEISNISRSKFKALVDTSVQDFALKELNSENASKSKSKQLSYTSLKLLSYLQNLFPSKSRTIFKCRSKTLDIKDHKPFKFKDRLCRRCGSEMEDLEHVVNCISNYGDGLLKLDVMREDHDETHLLSVANRVERFFEEG